MKQLYDSSAGVIRSLILGSLLCFSVCLVATNQFVKPAKIKKESGAKVQQDIAELLESAIRQLNQNVQQAMYLQNKLFDQLKQMMDDTCVSVSQLQDLRNSLEKNLAKIEKHRDDLDIFIRGA